MWAVVLTGASEPDDGWDHLLLADVGLMGRSVLATFDLGEPLLVAANGHAIGAGMILIMAGDIRVMARGATTTLTEVKLGLLTEGGGTALLADELPPALVGELLFTGNSLTAERAREAGFINRLAEPDDLLDLAQDLAATIAANAPLTQLMRCATVRPPTEGNAMETVVVTGSSSGIGEATALLFARKGYRVFATMRNPVVGFANLRALATAEELALEAVAMDVSRPDSVHQAMATILDAVGHVDVLVNNAAITGGGSIEEASEESWHEVFETNFHGAVRTIRAVLPHMRAAGRGTIVNVSSAAGQAAIAGQDQYTPTKYALEAMSEILAQEVLRFGIRVAIVQPGVTATPIFTRNVTLPDPASPYVEFGQRFGRLVAKRLRSNPNTAESVAEIIHHAVITDSPKLRYAAADSAALIRFRKSRTDEEWVDYGREMTRDEFANFTAQWWDNDLPD